MALVSVENSQFLVQVDSGSTDTVLPYANLNAYTGPTINYSIPEGKSRVISSLYGDGSFWYGYPARVNISLVGTRATGLAPISLMTSQSTLPVFAGGTPYQGLMGIGFEPLASQSDPYSVLDAWIREKTVSKNQIAFHGCPYDREEASWIDFGNDTPYNGCGRNVRASVLMPAKSYYNVNLRQIQVAGNTVSLPRSFQSSNRWSFFDSCTSNIMVPRSTLTTIQETILASDAISEAWINSGYITQWLDVQVMIPFGKTELDFSLLPNISFTISTQAFDTLSNVTLTLGPHQYIQANTNGFYMFMITSMSETSVIFGLPFFSAYHIVVDRDLGKLTFQIGCGCYFATDGYPKITTAGKILQSALLGEKVPINSTEVNL
jgi:Eukaryotic aspartyl protease